MADVSRDDILKLAHLARLNVTDEEVTAYASELSEILDYVAVLDTIDVAGLKPTNQVTGLTNVTRADEIVDYGYTPEDLLALVPNVEADHIKVNRMIG